jgi:transposase-like protein/IS1 family transposase
MLCPVCGAAARRFGRDRRGHQRFQCPACPRTFTDPDRPAEDRRRIPAERAVSCLRHLLEGSSIRSTERLTETHRDTIMDLLVDAGERCQRFLEQAVRLVPVRDVQADEIWAFVGCKEKTRLRRGYGEEVGDCWCFTAIERTTKMILAFHVGKRTPEATQVFADKLRHATRGRFQLSTDGFRPYLTAIPESFGATVDYAQLVKVYANPPEEGTAARYSPGEVVDTYSVRVIGNPAEERICTSHAERSNKTMRMQIRRLTRLTDGHSKKWANHEAALALFFAYYNYCRPHKTLTEATWEEEGRALVKTTPAMAAGLTDHVWTVEELLERAGRCGESNGSSL